MITSTPGVQPESLLSGRVTVRRGSALVVRDFHLDIPRGTAVGIVGRNGAGKSTLLSGICGLLPTSGDLQFDGVSLLKLAPYRRALSGLALVPQGRGLVNELTVEENLRTARLAPFSTGPSFDIYQMFPHLRVLHRKRAGLLSGGQQQQVAIARALVRRPRLLLLDEPSEGLAPVVTDSLVAALLTAISSGLTLIIAEQRLDLLDRVCDRALVIRSGLLVASGSTASTVVREQATVM